MKIQPSYLKINTSLSDDWNYRNKKFLHFFQPILLAQLFHLFFAFSLIVLQSTVSTTSIFMLFKILGYFQDGFGC